MQAALQYILMAGKCENAEDIVDPGWKVLAAQCYMLMGNAKLQEVYATKVRLQGNPSHHAWQVHAITGISLDFQHTLTIGTSSLQSRHCFEMIGPRACVRLAQMFTPACVSCPAQHAVEALQQRVDSLTAKQADLERRNPEYERTVQRIRDTRCILCVARALHSAICTGLTCRWLPGLA